MKKRYKALFAALLTGALAAGCLAGCGKMDGTAGGKMKKVTLNEVAHSIFYAPQYAAIELGYFEEEGIDLTLVNGAGADKVMTALISGDAQIGFMGSEASIYVSQEGADDPAVNFAQLTQRAGNFLVGRTAQPDFKWEDLKGKKVLGGRAGGMPQMVFEYILKKNGLDPVNDLTIDRASALASPRRHLPAVLRIIPSNSNLSPQPLKWREAVRWWRLSEQNPAMYPIRPTAPEKAI